MLEKDHIYKIGQIKAATQWACFYFILQKKTATYKCDKKRMKLTYCVKLFYNIIWLPYLKKKTFFYSAPSKYNNFDLNIKAGDSNYFDRPHTLCMRVAPQPAPSQS